MDALLITAALGALLVVAAGLGVARRRTARRGESGELSDVGAAVHSLAHTRSVDAVPPAATRALLAVPGVAGAAWLHVTAAHLQVTAGSGELTCLGGGITTAPMAALPGCGQTRELEATEVRSLLRPISQGLPDRALRLVGVGEGQALAIAVNAGADDAHLEAVALLAATVWERAGLGASLRRTQHRSHALANGAADLTVVVGANGRILEADGPVADAFDGALRDRRLFDYVHPSDHAITARLARSTEAEPVSRGELRVGRDGRWQVLDVVASDLRRDPEVRGVVLTGRDVTVRANTHRDLAQQALHDPLTGLPNRSAFQQRLRRALDRHGARVGVLFVDLDAFKPINDTYGHAVGDAALCVVAQRLRSVIRDDDIVARLAGDEFAALTVGADSVAKLRALAHRLVDVVSQPASLPDDIVLDLRASVGGALARGGDVAASALLDAADRAMYATKHQHTAPVVTVVEPGAATASTAASPHER